MPWHRLTRCTRSQHPPAVPSEATYSCPTSRPQRWWAGVSQCTDTVVLHTVACTCHTYHHRVAGGNSSPTLGPDGLASLVVPAAGLPPGHQILRFPAGWSDSPADHADAYKLSNMSKYDSEPPGVAVAAAAPDNILTALAPFLCCIRPRPRQHVTVQPDASN